MLKRLAFPIGALALLAAAMTVAPPPAFAGGVEIMHCNNKYCGDYPLGVPYCVAQANGPRTHCIEWGAYCVWDMCGGTEE